MQWLKQHYGLLRRLLFLLPPELAHTIGCYSLKYFSFNAPLLNATEVPFLQFQLPHCLGLAAGFDKNADYIDDLFSTGFSFVEVGTVTPLPQMGNAKPRLFRLPEHQALINRMGFNNKGVDYLVKNLQSRSSSGIVGVNIGKNKTTPLDKAANDYVLCLQKVYPYADYIVINLSSPNTPGLRDLMGQNYLQSLLKAVTEKQQQLCQQHQKKVPILLKTTVDVDDEQVKSIVDLSLNLGLSGMISSNTTVDRSQIQYHRFCKQAGGVSGAPLTDRALNRMRLLRSLVPETFELVGVGGIMSGDDAKARLEAGANVLQTYTGFIYSGPQLIADIAKIQSVN